MVDASDSAILKYGPEVQAIGQCNMLFSLHVYTEWKDGSQVMSNYIDAVNNAGMAMIIGEVGRTEDAATVASFGATKQHHITSVNAAYEVAPQKGVGVLAWHGACSDPFDIVLESDLSPKPYWAKNSSGSNLTPFGQLHWNLAQNTPVFAADSNVVVPSCIL